MPYSLGKSHTNLGTQLKYTSGNQYKVNEMPENIAETLH